MKHLISAQNVYEGAAMVANEIARLVSSGVRYRDIVVAVCDYDDTAPIYEQTFAASNIPVNLDVGERLMDHAYTKYLRDKFNKQPWVTPDAPAEICDEDIDAKIKEILDQIPPHAEYVNAFCSLASATKVSATPAYADRVLVVSCEEWVPTRTPYIFVTGASNGVFPRATPDTDIITMQDIAAMSIRIEPSARDTNRRHCAHAQNILAAASAGVYIAHSDTNARGERSGGVTPLARDFAPIPDATPACRSFARTRALAAIGEGTADEYWASVARAADLPNYKIPTLGVTDAVVPDCADLFMPKGHLSPTGIEKFCACPYNYFLTAGLGLEQRQIAGQIPPNVIGSILHTFAEQFVRKGGAPDKLMQQILVEHKLPARTTRALVARAAQIAKFLTTDIDASPHKPQYFEETITGEINGTPVKGRADRIDVDPDAKTFVVVDYKSGGAGPVRLQLALYMHFFEKEKLQPAGAYYLGLKDFHKRPIGVEDIDAALQTATDAIERLKSGAVPADPIHRDVCEYCVAKSLCGRWSR